MLVEILETKIYKRFGIYIVFKKYNLTLQDSSVVGQHYEIDIFPSKNDSSLNLWPHRGGGGGGATTPGAFS